MRKKKRITTRIKNASSFLYYLTLLIEGIIRFYDERFITENQRNFEVCEMYAIHRTIEV